MSSNKGNVNTSKLKHILINPYKTRCPALKDDELCELKEILESRIKTSELDPKSFLKTFQIQLGLESSLRAINSNNCSCVLLSLNLKPRFILNLIKRNVELKDSTVPVYAQPNLEYFTEKIFGIRALALVITKDSIALSKGLEKWISTCTKLQPNVSIIQQTVKKTKRNKIKKIKNASSSEESIVESISTKIQSEKVEKDLNSDYISFGNVNKMIKMENSLEDKMSLANVLDKISANVQKELVLSTIEGEQLKNESNENVKDATSINTAIVEMDVSDSDDFMEDYIPLNVQKVLPNPERKPRKRRKKKCYKKCSFNLNE